MKWNKLHTPPALLGVGCLFAIGVIVRSDKEISAEMLAAAFAITLFLKVSFHLVREIMIALSKPRAGQ